MNVELFELLIKTIKEKPYILNMECYLVKIEEHSWSVYKTDAVPDSCGTVGCIAGWASYLCGEDFESVFISAALLGIQNNWNFRELFYPWKWPFEFQDRLSQFKAGTPEYADVVVDYIKLWMEQNA